MVATTIHDHGFYNDICDEEEAECLDEPEDPSIGFGFSCLTYLEQEYSLYACTQLLGMIIHAEQKDFLPTQKNYDFFVLTF